MDVCVQPALDHREQHFSVVGCTRRAEEVSLACDRFGVLATLHASSAVHAAELCAYAALAVAGGGMGVERGRAPVRHCLKELPWKLNRPSRSCCCPCSAPTSCGD
jgi:hypothetical protein